MNRESSKKLCVCCHYGLYPESMKKHRRTKIHLLGIQEIISGVRIGICPYCKSNTQIINNQIVCVLCMEEF